MGRALFLGQDGSVEVAAVERKPVVGAESLSKAREVLSSIGSARRGVVEIVAGEARGRWDARLEEAIQSKSRRVQCLRHAAALEVSRALCVSSAKSRILRVADIRLTERVRRLHLRIMRNLRIDHLNWAFDAPCNFPNPSANEHGFAKSNANFKAAMKFSHDMAKHAASNGAFVDER